MSISYDFFKDEKPVLGKIEDQILFFIENYSTMMSMFRVMMAQLEKTKEKKEHAHQQLQELRAVTDRIEHGEKLSDQEKIELEEKRVFLTLLREEDDIVYFNGKPMSYDETTTLILRYQKLLSFLEPVDARWRKKIALILKKRSKYLSSPICSLLKFTSKNTKKNTKRTVLEAHELMENLPETIYRKVVSSINVDLSEHIPKDE